MVHPQPEVHMSAFSSGNIPHELLEALLGNPYESQILVDADGIVRYMSPSYRNLLSIVTVRRNWPTLTGADPA